MLSKIKSMRGRIGPIGSALAAAALTAAVFAAVSVAQGDDGSKGDNESNESGPRVFEHRAGPPPDLSEEDREALESFRKCMEENGADLPEPPQPGELEDGERPKPPEPPTEQERAAIEKAHQACEDKLPEGAEFGLRHCGPPPSDGARGEREGASS